MTKKNNFGPLVFHEMPVEFFRLKVCYGMNVFPVERLLEWHRCKLPMEAWSRLVEVDTMALLIGVIKTTVDHSVLIVNGRVLVAPYMRPSNFFEKNHAR
jgi:hypothetical protein